MQQLNATRLNYYLSLILIFFLQGCASTNSDQQKTPEWVLTPTQDTAQYIYGIGQGTTLDEAKQHALKTLASKFSVSVNSDTLHKQSLHNGRTDELFSQEINTHVKAIEFTHFEQIKAEQVKQQYYMLVAINRQGFINNNKSKLAAIRSDISTMLADVNNKSKIEKLYVYNKLQKEVTKAEPCSI
ncbi:LPP20 family lipoprotein [Psychromonas sp. MME1]|uniref:LPP20 family lipoprotein n=1 Tax=Psychromonas sp. MME1 TaxID=3231032 RepID=UPI0034E28392